MKARLLPLLVLGMVGCRQPAWPKGSVAHVLIEEEGFSPEQVVKLKAAVSEWETVLEGRVTFEYVTEKGCDNLIVIRAQDYRALADDGYNAVTYVVPWERGGNIEMPYNDPPKWDKYFVGLALHELGHALSLDHVERHDAVMFHTVSKAALHVTCADLEQFCDVNGCYAKDFQLCQTSDET